MEGERYENTSELAAKEEGGGTSLCSELLWYY